MNAGEIDRLLALSDERIEIGGPRGAGHGRNLLRDWAGRSGIRLRLQRIYARDGTVVAEEAASWATVDQEAGQETSVVASVFQVKDSLVMLVVRHPNLAGALAAAELSEQDEVVRPPG